MHPTSSIFPFLGQPQCGRHSWMVPQVVLSLASAPNMCRQMALPASMQQSGAAAHHMTKGSLLPRKEMVLDTGWCLGEETAVDFVFLAAKTKGFLPSGTSATRTRFSQVTFLDLLTEKKTFLVYKDDKWDGKGIPKKKFHTGYNHLHSDTQQVIPVLPVQGPFTIGGYENVCKHMLDFMKNETGRKRIFLCYNLPLYLGYFKHFFSRFESHIYGFVDLEWCLGVETPDHLIPWLQMVNIKVRVPSEPEESDTMSQGLNSMYSMLNCQK